jgi:hypothetical protein
MSLSECRAFTVEHNKLVRQIRSEILVSDGMMIDVASKGPEQCGAKSYIGIWDTGASSSAITQKVADDLKLRIVSRGITSTAAGKVATTGHTVHLWLPHKVVITNCIASCVDLGILGVDLLIGMDVIGRGDFSISNFNGKTMMSFREPSMEHADYTKPGSPGIAPLPGRNAPCPCGSGKKYKHCHGKGN